jgi:hypothetical protein
MIKAVLCDFGVAITMSPFEAFRNFERRHNLLFILENQDFSCAERR